MPTSSGLRARCAADWGAAVGHRFVDALWQGEVPRSALVTYLVQDNQFFDAFVALLGASVATADRPGPRIAIARQLGVVAGAENDFFARALEALEVPQVERREPTLSAPTRGLLEEMATAAASRSYAQCLTVLLVAEWVYLDWATRPEARLPDGAIEREWIELHRGPGFEAWVHLLRTEFDRVAAADPQVPAIFARVVALERDFFDAAYGTGS